MKPKLLGCLLVLSIFIVSCTKNKEVTNAPTPPAQPGGTSVDNDEYFWNYPWKKDSNNYVITVESPRLTDSAISRGIEVSVAEYSDWSPFRQLPLTLYDSSLPDTVNLSFIATPGELHVIAKAPFAITWRGDVSIKYR